MKPNVGGFDGFFRTLIFVITIIYAVMTGHWLWTIPGAALFATAVLAWCPISAMLGVNTDKMPSGH